MRARGLSTAALLVLAAGLSWWVAARHGARPLAHWRSAVRVHRAEDALEAGQEPAALQMLAAAGESGRRRLGELVVASHNERRWSAFVDVLHASGPEVREAVADVLTRSPEEHLSAAEALAALGDPRGVQALSGALVSPSPEAHDPAELTSLGSAGVEALVRVARFGAPQAQERALTALGYADTPGARRGLVRLMRDRSFPLRALALQVAGPRGGQALRLDLEDFLSDPDPPFRAEAVFQCACLRGAEALPELARALRDEGPVIRGRAVEALQGIEGPQADGLLIAALGDADPAVVEGAVRRLGWRGCRAAKEPLARLYPRCSREARRQIATALGWMGSPLGPLYRRRWEQETGQTLTLSSEWDG